MDTDSTTGWGLLVCWVVAFWLTLVGLDALWLLAVARCPRGWRAALGYRALLFVTLAAFAVAWAVRAGDRPRGTRLHLRKWNRTMAYRLYLSDRDIPLVYCGPPPRAGRILTVENYLKWYSFSTVDAAGAVAVFDPTGELARQYEETYPSNTAWGDHVPFPLFCHWAAKTHPDLEWDEESLETIYGRWVAEADTAEVAAERGKTVFELHLHGCR